MRRRHATNQAATGVALNRSNNRLQQVPESISNLQQNLIFLDLRGNPIPEEDQARIRAWLPNTTITF